MEETWTIVQLVECLLTYYVQNNGLNLFYHCIKPSNDLKTPHFPKYLFYLSLKDWNQVKVFILKNLFVNFWNLFASYSFDAAELEACDHRILKMGGS